MSRARPIYKIERVAPTDSRRACYRCFEPGVYWVTYYLGKNKHRDRYCEKHAAAFAKRFKLKMP